MERATILALPAARLAVAAATAPAVTQLALAVRCDSTKPTVVASHGTARRRRRPAAPAAQQDHGREYSTRKWRLHASNNGPSREEPSTTGLSATKYSDSAQNSNNNTNTNTVRFGSSEASCDEGSSFLAVESVLENEGGKSVEDYKLRAHIFAESAVFFAALRDRNINHNDPSATE